MPRTTPIVTASTIPAPQQTCVWHGIIILFRCYVACRQCAMIGWHVAWYWATGDGGRDRSLLSRWRPPLRGIGNMASGFPLFGTGSNHHTPLHVQVKKWVSNSNSRTQLKRDSHCALVPLPNLIVVSDCLKQLYDKSGCLRSVSR